MNFKKRVNASWHDSHYIHNTSTDTITTLPAVLYPTGTTATAGLKGQAVQSGTPTPDSPIMPEWCGERTGNLFDYKTAYASYINADGDVAATTLGTIRNSLADFVGQTITIRVYCKTVTATRTYVTSKIGDAQKSSNSIYQGNTGYMALTVTPETADDYWNVSYGSLGTGNNIYSDFMVNTGSTAISYEPYGYKIPISSANTTTPIYLGEVVSTRRVKKLVFDGTENWYVEGSNIFYTNPITEALRYAPICSHYKGVHIFSGNNQVTISQTLRINIKTTTITHTATDFKTYLQQQYAAGTPVTVWYVLAEPETAVVNEPLMRIGDYVDTLSNISIPVTAGGDTISVGTTVQPSEVTVNYKGWHPVADVHERNNGAWT